MDHQLGVIAAESREDMAFWPVATVAYFFTQSGGLLHLLILSVISVPGAFSYLLLKHLRHVRKTTKNKRATINKVSRPGLSQDQISAVSE